MTRSKLEFATILVSLRGSGEDPIQIAQEMTLRKLCYEIEKAEEELTLKMANDAPPEPKPETKPERKPRSLWGFVTHDSDSE